MIGSEGIKTHHGTSKAKDVPSVAESDSQDKFGPGRPKNSGFTDPGSIELDLGTFPTAWDVNGYSSPVAKSKGESESEDSEAEEATFEEELDEEPVSEEPREEDESDLRASDFIMGEAVDSHEHVSSDNDSAEEGPDEETYFVERIIAHRGRGEAREYLVKWEGYPSTENSWIAHNDFAGPEIVDNYERSPRGRKTGWVAAQSYWVVQNIVSHRVSGKKREHLVEWEGCPPSQNSWVKPEAFGDDELIKEYEASIV